VVLWLIVKVVARQDGRLWCGEAQEPVVVELLCCREPRRPQIPVDFGMCDHHLEELVGSWETVSLGLEHDSGKAWWATGCSFLLRPQDDIGLGLEADVALRQSVRRFLKIPPEILHCDLCIDGAKLEWEVGNYWYHQEVQWLSRLVGLSGRVDLVIALMLVLEVCLHHHCWGGAKLELEAGSFPVYLAVQRLQHLADLCGDVAQTIALALALDRSHRLSSGVELERMAESSLAYPAVQ
jgi:hypothetical protein